MKGPPRSVRIRLEAWEHEWAIHVGTQRHEIRRGSGDAAHYDPARMEDNLRASIASACCEMAVAKYHKTYWSGTYWPVDEHDRHKGLPDVEPNYEVKRIREAGNPLPVRRGEVKAGRVVVAAWADDSENFRDVYVIGEIDAAEGFARGMRADYDPTGTRLVPQAFLTTYGARKRKQAS